MPLFQLCLTTLSRYYKSYSYLLLADTRVVRHRHRNRANQSPAHLGARKLFQAEMHYGDSGVCRAHTQKILAFLVYTKFVYNAVETHCILLLMSYKKNAGLPIRIKQMCLMCLI